MSKDRRKWHTQLKHRFGSSTFSTQTGKLASYNNISNCNIIIYTTLMVHPQFQQALVNLTQALEIISLLKFLCVCWQNYSVRLVIYFIRGNENDSISLPISKNVNLHASALLYCITNLLSGSYLYNNVTLILCTGMPHSNTGSR